MSSQEYPFSEIHRTYQPKIRRYRDRMVGKGEAEDLPQEVLFKIYQSLSTFRGDSRLSTRIYRR